MGCVQCNHWTLDPHCRAWSGQDWKRPSPSRSRGSILQGSVWWPSGSEATSGIAGLSQGLTVPPFGEGFFFAWQRFFVDKVPILRSKRKLLIIRGLRRPTLCKYLIINGLRRIRVYINYCGSTGYDITVNIIQYFVHNCTLFILRDISFKNKAPRSEAYLIFSL